MSFYVWTLIIGVLFCLCCWAIQHFSQTPIYSGTRRKCNRCSSEWNYAYEAQCPVCHVNDSKPKRIKLSLTKKPKKQSPICPLCKTGLATDVWHCNACQATYHVDCLDEMTAGKCATTGCGGKYILNQRVRA